MLSKKGTANAGVSWIILTAALLSFGCGREAGETGQPEVSATASTPTRYQWVQVVDGGASARAILDGRGAVCPDLTVTDSQGTRTVRMDNRPNTPGGPTLPPDFDITVCGATIASDVTSASINGKTLPLPNASPQKVVLLGDTGCRISSQTQQACNDPDAWLFPRTVESAVKQAPDLVIHVGDYIYREAECTTEGCAGSPWGQNWKTWEADFFAPAAPLLEKAAWIFARGNHEACIDHDVQREWRGWFLFLAPETLTADLPVDGCATEMFRSKPFKAAFGDFDALVMDTAETAALSDYQATLNLHAPNDPPAWLVTHRPLWGLGRNGDPDDCSNYFQMSPPDGLDFSQYPWFKLAVVGHLHIFEGFKFPPSSGKPYELLVGGGGTELDQPVDAGNACVKSIVNDQFGASHAEFIDKFTFVQLEKAGPGWIWKVIDVDGVTEKHRFAMAE